MTMDYTIRIGGEAGQGLQTIGGILAKVFARSGYHVFTHQDYMSRIRGGHNFYQLRFSDKPVTASRDKIDILVALNRETIELHRWHLNKGGIIVYDSEFIKEKYDGEEFLDVPFESIALKEGGSKIMANTVATASVLGMLGMDLTIYEEILKETFKKKGEEVINKNIQSARAGYDYAIKKCLKCNFSVSKTSRKRNLIINGNQAIGLGALLSGCRFYSAYPMTPSTGIMIYLASKAKEYGLVIEQAEDEISAINMALGASFAGVRAMTGSSGGGFALMVEGLSLAAMTETPIVIAEVQRPGPATGLPTRTEQGDLLFVLHAGHGEFPRVVFAPGSPEQALFLTNKAFELAEKYQIPVFILSDQYLADSEWTYTELKLGNIIYNDYRLRGEKLLSFKEYKRHMVTESGVSPLAIPGESEHLVVTDSDEHDEDGHIIEDAETRNRMVEKRLFKKLDLLRQEMSHPMLYGDPDPDIVLCGWGSTYGLLREAVDRLSDGLSVAMLHFSEVYPFPANIKVFNNIMKGATTSICIENNATGQFARLVRAETGLEFTHRINRFDGRPFTIDELLSRIDIFL